ncbi:transposase [Rhodococcus opacus]|uniref:transposase n=1 Tax=Rhodococcus opacus TaxID=37919 RepID=UPI00374F9108
MSDLRRDRRTPVRGVSVIVDDRRAMGGSRTVLRHPATPKGAVVVSRSAAAQLVLDPIFYVMRGGIAWRQLPAELPPATTVWRSSPAGCGQERGSSSTTPFATAPACGTDALRCRPR